MKFSCRGDIWLSDDSNNNIIYCAFFREKNKEMYNKMIGEAENKKYNIVMAALGIDDPYEFVDIFEGKSVLPHYIKLLDLFSSEENFENARRLIEHFERTSVDSDIFRMTIEKMWPEFSFFSDAMNCVSIERSNEFYDISEIKDLEEKLKQLKGRNRIFKNINLDEFSKIYSYQNDAINNMKVLSLLKKAHKISHPTEEHNTDLQEEQKVNETKKLVRKPKEKTS